MLTQASEKGGMVKIIPCEILSPPLGSGDFPYLFMLIRNPCSEFHLNLHEAYVFTRLN